MSLQPFSIFHGSAVGSDLSAAGVFPSPSGYGPPSMAEAELFPDGGFVEIEANDILPSAKVDFCFDGRELHSSFFFPDA